MLKDAGLLDERRDGTRRLYRARPDGLEALRSFLDEVGSTSLDVGARLVEEGAGRAAPRRRKVAG